RVLPGISLPRFVTELTGPRNRVETPKLFAGSDVESARIARSGPATFRTRKAQNDDVAVNCGRRSRPIINPVKIHIHAFPKIDAPAFPERGIRQAGFGIERY